jgi:hypothetical protein
MIIGNKEYKRRVLKNITEVEYKDLQGFKLTSTLMESIASAFVYTSDERYFKDYFEKNEKLEVGSTIRVQRWDWNGIDDEFSAKIKTKKGKIIFDTREKCYSKQFKWNNKQKNDWVKRAKRNVDFTYKYIETE